MSEWTIWAGLLLHRMVRLVVCPGAKTVRQLAPFSPCLIFSGVAVQSCVAGAPRFNWVQVWSLELSASQTGAWILSWRGVA